MVQHYQHISFITKIKREWLLTDHIYSIKNDSQLHKLKQHQLHSVLCHQVSYCLNWFEKVTPIKTNYIPSTSWTYKQGDSEGICNTMGNDRMCDSKQKSSYEH